MPPPEGRGSLKATMDALDALEDAVVERAAELGGTLHAYRWWRPDMELPCVYNWLTPATTENLGGGAGAECKVDDLLRITITIAVDPAAVRGEGDMLELEEYADLFRDVADPVIFGRNPLGQKIATRRGFQTVAGVVGGVPVLCIEFPLEVHLLRSVHSSP